MAVAGWSELPIELLNLISERLDNEVDFIRFRSICSTWRSSTIPNHHHHHLPFMLPRSKQLSFVYLSKCSHFLIKPSPQTQQQQEQTLVRRPWLIQISKNTTGKLQLLLPHLISPSYFHSTHLDFIQLSILHLGTDFILDFDMNHDFVYVDIKKVIAVTPLTLAILYGYNQLVLLHRGDRRCTEIPHMSSSIGDICVFKGQLYAVQKRSGKLVTVAPEDLSVQLLAKDVHGGGGDIKFLVESEGELLLVDVYKPLFNFALGSLAYKNTLKIDVFKLDEKRNKWVKLTSLGDRILFLGNGCSFSISASDLYVAKGNCVIFMDDVFDNNILCQSGMCVFHLDQGWLSPLCNYPDYLALFWPPPEWIIEGYMHKGEKQRKKTRGTR